MFSLIIHLLWSPYLKEHKLMAILSHDCNWAGKTQKSFALHLISYHIISEKGGKREILFSFYDRKKKTEMRFQLILTFVAKFHHKCSKTNFLHGWCSQIPNKSMYWSQQNNNLCQQSMHLSYQRTCWHTINTNQNISITQVITTWDILRVPDM